MAKRARKQPEHLWLNVDIDETLAHYAFGERWPQDRDSPGLTEFLSVTIWGTVTSPREKAGRDLQATLTGSEGFTLPWRNLMAGQPSPPIGELQWAATRVARVHVPPDTMWNLVAAVSAGHLRRLGLCVDTPLRGSVPVRRMHLLTRELELAMLDKGG